jgi:RND family efflux transporter MFP subunit
MEFHMKPRLPFISALLLSLLFIACGEKIEPGTAKVSHPSVTGVRLATAQMVRQPLVYEAVGTVQAGITTELAAKLMGTVETIAVREGDRVKRGDILVRLDQRQSRAGLHQAEAGLEEAQQALAATSSARDAALAAAELAASTYARYQALKRDDSVSAQEFDEVEARHRQAQAASQQAEAMVQAAAFRVSQARAALALAQVTLKDTEIIAPHPGIITAKLVDEGDLATPGRPLLTLETTDRYRLDVVLPESYIEDVSLQLKVRANIPALNGAVLEGTVSTIVPAADPGSRSFLIKVALPPTAQVKSGMFARVRIPRGFHDQFTVPLSAVVRHGQLTGLYIVDAGGIAHLRLVRLGGVFQDAVEVLSGINQGDRYVVKPPPTLVDGCRVEAAS